MQNLLHMVLSPNEDGILWIKVIISNNDYSAITFTFTVLSILVNFLVRQL